LNPGDTLNIIGNLSYDGDESVIFSTQQGGVPTSIVRGGLFAAPPFIALVTTPVWARVQGDGDSDDTATVTYSVNSSIGDLSQATKVAYSAAAGLVIGTSIAAAVTLKSPLLQGVARLVTAPLMAVAVKLLEKTQDLPGLWSVREPVYLCS
jgi:hypothetical protein